jgi:hypothetical protein
VKLRGIVRERASSTSIKPVDQERTEKYERRLARQMLLYPVRVRFNNVSELTDINPADRVHNFDRPPYTLSLPRMGRP